jgi:methylenetetrahydrofolate reductase (NADPH)
LWPLLRYYEGKLREMRIIDKFDKKGPVLSFEIFPPKKDSSLKDIDKTLESLCGLNPDFISVTFGAGGSANNNKTVELAKKIKYEYGVEPLVHLTCLSYDKSEMMLFHVACDSGLKTYWR